MANPLNEASLDIQVAGFRGGRVCGPNRLHRGVRVLQLDRALLDLFQKFRRGFGNGDGLGGFMAAYLRSLRDSTDRGASILCC
jgi:hypothetical protein